MKTARDLRAKAPRPDAGVDPGRPLLVVIAALCVVGLVMVLSASSVDALRTYGSSWYFFVRQAIYVGLGGVALWLTARVDYHVWRKFAAPAVAVVLFLMACVLVPGLGQTAYGARRWLGVGPLQFQPSELAKLALILFSADILARHPPQREGPAPLYVIGGVTLVALVLVMGEPDMGTGMIILGTVLAVLILGGIPLKPLLAGLGGIGVVGTFVAIFEPYRRERLLSFADPFKSASGSGYQQVQALVGLGSGGVRGVGLGASKSKWGFLPNAHTDFIFAIIGEELGLFGSIGVVALFVALAVFGIRAATRAPDAFGALVAGGITAWLVGQAALNMAAVVGVLPVTGVPLPFVSLGGTSTIFGMAAAGILVNVARQRRPASAKPSR
ncbi:MAG TPA: putative lipid II flippase FtsW [Acidimicrobiales bacterium]|nr:putative lipid II flippase FtsW [Acidimicrobiales bacterium]